jgi:S1-C subfamily serine protease
LDAETQQRLGLRVQELTPELAKLMDSQLARGVVITDVVSGGAAVKAGLQRGDIITKLNDQPVATSAALQGIVQGLPKASRVNMEVMRKGKPQTIVVELP